MEQKKPIRLDELDRHSPLRSPPFKVPEGYFDTLPTQIQAKAARPSNQTMINWSWHYTITSLTGASLVAALIWMTYPQQQTSLGTDILGEVSEKAIIEYLSEQNLGIDDLAESSSSLILPKNSTMLYYLNVTPQVIEQELMMEGAFDETI